MPRRFTAGALVAALLALIAVTATTVSAHPGGDSSRHERTGHGDGPVSHVLLISVDGLHQSDLAWYMRRHPDSELAQLASSGTAYYRAQTPIPSDSFPGMLAQVTGGNPRTTGVYYDAAYSHALLAPDSTCPGGTPGAPVSYDESLDLNPDSIDAGQGLPGLPDGVLAMTSNPFTVIDQSKLPLDPSTCQTISPHQYLKVNTIFDVAKAHGLRTAWSDKHAAYDVLQGPSGHGIDDLFTPEINSVALHHDGTPYGGDWTTDNAATRQYDAYKVQAIVNEIDGYDHTGTGPKVGVPAIFGMNFQTVSTAEKLPRSEGTVGGPQLNGGYLPHTRTPGPLLADALGWLDSELATMADELRAQGLANSTAIILSAKHGQSPQDPTALTRIDDGTIIDGLNSAWRAHLDNPSAPDLVAGGTNDDALMLWLSDRSPEAARFTAQWLMSHPATGTTYNAADPTTAGPSRTLPSSGLVRVFTGRAAARYFGVEPSDPRHPDVWGVVQHGVVYTGGTKKIAEHGGPAPEDRDVPLLVDVPRKKHGKQIGASVETTQIAPTILRLLGLDPSQLQAVQREGTHSLPGLG